MQFKLANLFTTALAVASASATLSSTIVINIEKITDLSQDTDNILMDLSSPFSIFTVVPRAIISFKDIVTTATSSATMLANVGDETIDSDDAQQEVCDAFTGFVKVHIALLETVIGKGGLLSSTPFTAPIAAVLRAIEGVVDTLAFGLIGLIPSCADDAMVEKMKLDNTLDKAIKTYSFSIGKI